MKQRQLPLLLFCSKAMRWATVCCCPHMRGQGGGVGGVQLRLGGQKQAETGAQGTAHHLVPRQLPVLKPRQRLEGAHRRMLCLSPNLCEMIAAPRRGLH